MDYLEKFFERGIFPAEEMIRPSGADYRELENQCRLLRETLRKELNEEQKELLDQITETWRHISLFDMSASFARGFRTGGRLIGEIYKNA